MVSVLIEVACSGAKVSIKGCCRDNDDDILSVIIAENVSVTNK